MDTRAKILSVADAVEMARKLRDAGGRVVVVLGYFDVLQPEMIRAVESCASPGTHLFAMVGDPPVAITSRAARVESAAALRVIDYVVSCSGEPEGMFGENMFGGNVVRDMQPHEIVRHERLHAESTARLQQRVMERHSVPVAGRQGN